MQYTIKAVSSQTRSYETKFGPMISYKVMFEGEETPVEVSQKAATAAPKVGDVVEGTIDTSGQYGPKFKKEYNQGGFGGAPRGGSSGGNKYQSDPFTMYLSYAKDVAVALIGTKDGFDADKFADILEQVELGGKTLYGSRPGAEEKTESKDVAPTTVSDKSIEEFFADEGDKPIDTIEIPF